jgi:hypothetical protein
MVAAAVDLAGGVPAVTKLCGVSRQSVYSWIREWRVERLTDALKLSQASGISIEKFAGQTLGSKPATKKMSTTKAIESCLREFSASLLSLASNRSISIVPRSSEIPGL